MPEAMDINSFRPNFYSIVDQIPKGKITTYGCLAESLGDKRAARAVGTLLNQNPNPIETPCHRVIRSNGEIGGYAKGKQKKKELLRKEGIKIKNNKVINFKEKLYKDFKTEYPLKKLRKEQLKAKEKIRLENDFDELRYIGGIDASYKNGKVYVVLFVIDEQTQEEHIVKHSEEVKFPYITTYLAFRELPPFMNTIKKSKIKPDVILVDGNGTIHPKGIGQACHLGVESKISTIGVAKNLLYGEMSEEVSHEDPITEILEQNRRIGYAYLSSERAKNPIYVSPGHRIDYKTSLEQVKKYCNYKSPRPIRKAHILSGEMRDKEKI